MRGLACILIAASLIACKDPGAEVRRDVRGQLVNLVAELESGIPIQTLEARLTKLKATVESTRGSFSAEQYAKLDAVYFWGLGGSTKSSGVAAMLEVERNSPNSGGLTAKALQPVEKIPPQMTKALGNQITVSRAAAQIQNSAKEALALFPPK